MTVNYNAKCGKSGGGSSNKARAILNGVVGDFLVETGNEIGIPMSLYPSTTGDEEALDVSTFALDVIKKKICIFVHGLTDDESSWILEDGSDYGSLLLRDHSILPLYLRYNTGLHISTNGQKLSRLLQALYERIQTQVESIAIIAHSMGGLVTRSACIYAKRHKTRWVRKVSHVIFLGTPHHGSPWEKIGNVVTNTLDRIPLPYMKLVGSVGNLRSAGIKDLRYGYVLDEDWQDHDQNDLLNNTKTQDGSELLEWTKYYAATGTITTNPNHIASHLVGDALVRKDSAMGRSNDEVHDLNIDPDNIREFPGVGHIQLSSDINVYKQVEEWILQPWDGPPPLSDWECHECERREDAEAAALPPSDGGKWRQARGVATLIQTSVDKGATAVEGVQRELTDEVYDVLEKIPPIAPAAKAVHAVQNTCVSGIYSIIRGVNFGVGEATKQAFTMIEEKETY